jgi:hypothetical protein
VPLEEQLKSFTWREMVRVPIGKLDDDAFTTAMVQAFVWALERGSAPAIGARRRVEQFQQTTVNWERLIALAQRFNQTDMVDQFRIALNQEADHLAFVRRCLTNEINREAGIS